MKIAVFGDLGGHYDPYVSALEALEVDVKKAVVPENLTVIQVGDLIDRGPDSEKVVEFVDKLIRYNPKNYVQLLGNHEGRLLGGPQFFEFNGKEYPLSTRATRLIQNWWVTRYANMAVGIKDVKTYGDLLVTHAGLTYWQYWHLGSKSLQSTITSLNALTEQQAFSPGIMLGGIAQHAGVAWADCVEEVYLPWSTKKEVPFGQIHGHTKPYRYNKKLWKDLGPELLPHAHVDKINYHTTVWIGGKPFIGIDPGFGKYDPGRPIRPFIVEGTLIVS